MDVLSSRVLLHPTDPLRSRAFYRDVLGLAVYREFGDPADPGLVFFIGNGLLELSGASTQSCESNLGLWLQVRDLKAEHQRLLGAGVHIDREPALQPWGLWEMSMSDPDGVAIVLVQIPDNHPLRRDPRSL